MRRQSVAALLLPQVPYLDGVVHTARRQLESVYVEHGAGDLLRVALKWQDTTRK
jgi:hypothetical protein